MIVVDTALKSYAEQASSNTSSVLVQSTGSALSNLQHAYCCIGRLVIINALVAPLLLCPVEDASRFSEDQRAPGCDSRPDGNSPNLSSSSRHDIKAGSSRLSHLADCNNGGHGGTYPLMVALCATRAAAPGGAPAPSGYWCLCGLGSHNDYNGEFER